ncbi:MAG: chemotaxis-specific protein-glutamate methyltransferase CheB [bacterium]
MKKALIVDDSLTAREYLKYILHASGDFQVVGMAEDGEEAIEKVKLTHPDVVIMDFYMPKMNGNEATRKIMESYPVPIVAVSATWTPEVVGEAFKAMEAGAVAAVGKPRGSIDSGYEDSVPKFVQTVRLMSEIKVVRRIAKYHKSEESSEESPKDHASKRVQVIEPRADISHVDIVAIGASTGGPPVIENILSGLSRKFPVPILIVQHISQGFLEGMVEWLSRNVQIPVLIPKDRDSIASGHVYFAPCGHHMGVTQKGDKIVLSKDPPEKSLRPAVSYLFRSVVSAFGEKAVGVLLTGMGADGAAELKMMKDRGAVTIAQDKESSVVHGMPGEAIRLGGVNYVLPPKEIASMLGRLVNRPRVLSHTSRD